MNLSLLRGVQIAVWAAVALLVVVLAWLFLQPGGPSKPLPLAPAIGGPFTLSDQNGATVTEAALRGHPSALFFGYTFCPDVCPTTLADITGWLRDLGPDGDRLKVYFITVDPERDTQPVLASYLEAFDSRITGLTGTKEAIDKVVGEYRIFAEKVPGKDGTSYTMNHTASVYLLNAQGQFVGPIDYQEDNDTVMAKLKRLIATS
jgi:protein SCO1/2